MSNNNPYDCRVVGLVVGGEVIVDKNIIQDADVFNVVLNVGIEDGYSTGSRFLIFELGPEIFDPDTEASLGHFEVVKGIGRISHVQSRQCTVRSQETKMVAVQKRSLNALAIAAGGLTEEMVERTAPFRKPKIGDYARAV